MKQTFNRFAVLSLDDEELASPPPQPQKPNIPPSNGGPLMDKVPAELRLEIFSMVLQTRYSVVNVGHLPVYKRGRKFNTALFRVSRTVSREAEEVFYKNNTIRVKSLNDPYTTREGTRNIELVGDVANRMFTWATPSTNVVTHAMGMLPKVQSLTLAIDCIFDGPQIPRLASRPGPSVITANGKIKSRRSCMRIVDFGVWEVPFESAWKERKYFMKRFRLVDAVRRARAQKESPSLADLRDRCLETDRRSEKYVEYMFALWIAGLEVLRAELAGEPIDEVHEQILAQHVMLPYLRPATEALLKDVPAGTRLLDLTVEEHGADVLEAANAVVGGVDLQPRR